METSKTKVFPSSLFVFLEHNVCLELFGQTFVSQAKTNLFYNVSFSQSNKRFLNIVLGLFFSGFRSLRANLCLAVRNSSCKRLFLRCQTNVSAKPLFSNQKQTFVPNSWEFVFSSVGTPLGNVSFLAWKQRFEIVRFRGPNLSFLLGFGFAVYPYRPRLHCCDFIGLGFNIPASPLSPGLATVTSEASPVTLSWPRS